MTATEEGLTEDFIIPAESITADAPGIVYVSFTRTAPEEFALSSFECTLKFVSKEVDPTTGTPEEEGYDDEYQVEQIDIGAGDVSLGSAKRWILRLETDLCWNTIVYHTNVCHFQFRVGEAQGRRNCYRDVRSVLVGKPQR
jgi:hypothetical protein